MKSWIIALPLVCMAGISTAQGTAPAEHAAAPAHPAAASPIGDSAAANRGPVAADARPQPAATAKRRAGKRTVRSLPKGDVRHCLELKTRAEVIRCSETQGRK